MSKLRKNRTSLFSFAVSVLFHAAIIAVLIFHKPIERQIVEFTVKSGNGDQAGKKKTGLADQDQNKKGEGHPFTGNIIERGGTGQGHPDKKFYWGIGVTLEYWKSELVTETGEKVSGTRISQVAAGYPAEESGLQVGDYIIFFNGQPYDDVTSPLRQAIDDGKEFELVIWRNGNSIVLHMRRAKIFYDE